MHMYTHAGHDIVYSTDRLWASMALVFDFRENITIGRDFRPFFQIGFLWLMFCFLDRLELPEEFGL